jgi:guanine deaminase
MKAEPNLMLETIRLATENVLSGNGGPFAAMIVRDGTIIATGVNRVTATNDPTAHAEINAIREACKALKSFQLDGCALYTSCEPCPMCLGAIYWARPEVVYFGNTCKDAARIGFDDSFIYEEIQMSCEERRIPFIRVLGERAIESFQAWERQEEKVEY